MEEKELIQRCRELYPELNWIKDDIDFLCTLQDRFLRLKNVLSKAKEPITVLEVEKLSLLEKITTYLGE